jgi:tetratricopeptide (TPR) repeat protein
MTGKKLFAGSLLMIALIALCGCASGKGKQSMSREYQKMVDLQSRKASAIRVEELALPAGYEATAETHEKMGDAYIRQDDSVAAFSEYQRSLEKDPLRTSARYKTGMIYLDRELPEDAIKEFNQVIVKDPQNASAYYGRARAHFLQKKLDFAKSDILEAIRLNDNLWQAHALLGVILDTEKDYPEAEDEYIKALLIQPDSATVYNDLGVSRYVAGRFDKAADAFLKAFNIDPGNRRICNNLGLALYRLGNPEDALEAFKKGGSDAAAYNNIGYLQMKDKKYNSALAALEKAIDANPSSYYERAQKNLDKVKDALKKSDMNKSSLE